MAAAETAPAVGTRRAVVRSERFVQWQRQLSSARRAPYGSRKRNTDEKMSGTRMQLKESEDAIGLNDSSRVMWHEDDRDGSGISQERLQKRQQQNGDCDGAERTSLQQFCENGPLILRESILFCNAKQSQQEQQLRPLQEQQELVPARPITRRGRRTIDRDLELQLPTRGECEDTNVLEGKRSTRSHTRTHCTEESPPSPLKVPKLHVVLSRKEVQEDWIKMTGQRYTGKPKKSTVANLGLGLCTSMTCASMIRRYLNDS